MNRFFKYLLRRLTPSKLFTFCSKVRMPQAEIDFRKFFVAKHLLKQGGSAIDGGAHIGYFTRLLASVLQPGGKIYSFEPNPYMYRLLAKYAKQEPRVQAMELALSNESQTNVSFYVTPYTMAEDSTLEEKHRQRFQKKVHVQTFQLDELLYQKIENLRLIKLDVEGVEQKVLEGAEKLLQQFCPWVIFEYCHTSQRDDSPILSYFSQKDYFCIDLATLGPLNPRTEIALTDGLAIPKKDEARAMSLLTSLQVL